MILNNACFEWLFISFAEKCKRNFDLITLLESSSVRWWKKLSLTKKHKRKLKYR